MPDPIHSTGANPDLAKIWSERARAYGARSVLSLRHPEAEFDAVTEFQKKVLLPLLAGQLHGNEKSVLDFGCGPGRFTGALSELMPGAMVTGFDICRELVDLAPRVPRVRFFCSDSETFLQQNHDTFDLIWICLVLGGIPDEALAPIGQNLYQKLNDGGLVFLIEHLADAGGSALWKHRPLNRYCELFPGIALKKIGTYLDIDSEVSVVAGRKHAPAV